MIPSKNCDIIKKTKHIYFHCGEKNFFIQISLFLVVKISHLAHLLFTFWCRGNPLLNLEETILDRPGPFFVKKKKKTTPDTIELRITFIHIYTLSRYLLIDSTQEIEQHSKNKITKITFNSKKVYK